VELINENKKEITTLSSYVSLFAYIKKCFNYRELVVALVKKDLKVKYAQTRLGLFLSVIQPVISLIIFTLFFGRFLKMESDGSPYPVFVFIGLISWYYFSLLVVISGTSLIESQQLIKKVYFPKLIIPFSKSISALVEFFIWLVVLVVLMITYRIVPSYEIFLFPVFLILNMIAGLTVGIWLSALTFRRRDFIHVVPYFVGLTMMVTPVFYPVTTIPQNVNYLIFLNPVAGIVQGFRWCITGGDPISLWYIPGFLFMILIFFFSIIYFKKVEYRMAEQL
jgi:lipopolysaccharide transport system permease protein